MHIRAIHARRFRSIESTSLKDCGGLNVLIGKNNAGKSDVLATIDVALTHLRRGCISGLWETNRRPQDEFCDRQLGRSLQLGIEFDLAENTNGALRDELKKEAPQLD